MTVMEPLNRTGLALVQTVSDMPLSEEPRQPPDLPQAQTASRKVRFHTV